ncbi:MAG: amidohydrolase family protein [Ekhidna sp.]
MKYTTIKKLTVRILLTSITVSIVSCIGIKSQIKQHTGAKTEIVNPADFKVHSSDLAITNVSVLSKDCNEMLDSLTVLIKDKKIMSVAKEITIPDEYQIIDGTGQYLIPGLNDTHVHLSSSKNDLLLHLANGITGVAEMFGSKQHLEWRYEAEEGSLSPDIYVATVKIASEKGLMPKIKGWFGGRKNFTTVKKAEEGVRKFKKQGYDAIKLSGRSESSIYYALVNEAKRQSIPAIGHLSFSVGLKNFYSSGQSQLAHIEEIVKNIEADFGGLYHDNAEEYLAYVNENSDSIAIKLRENNIVVSSTIWLMESIPKQKFYLDDFIKEIELEYVNPGLVEGSKMNKGWLPGNNHYEDLDIKNDLENSKRSQIYWEAFVEAIQIMTKALIENNVIIIAGTDANTSGIVSGFALHDEFESLKKCGMTNSQVLYAATVAPSAWMKNNTGIVEAGYGADLVLLAKNPLEDIRNTRSINAVITNGKYLDREVLDNILQSIKEANNRSREVNIDEFIN